MTIEILKMHVYELRENLKLCIQNAYITKHICIEVGYIFYYRFNA